MNRATIAEKLSEKTAITSNLDAWASTKLSSVIGVKVKDMAISVNNSRIIRSLRDEE